MVDCGNYEQSFECSTPRRTTRFRTTPGALGVTKVIVRVHGCWSFAGAPELGR